MVRSRLMTTRTGKKTGTFPKLSKRDGSAEPPKKAGRPRAKHSNPDYVQMSVYIHKDVRAKVKMRLFETGGEFSTLVESLLRDWLR